MLISASRLACVTCVLVLTAGCASYHASPISPERNAQALETRSLDDARLRAFIAAVSRPDPGPPDLAPAWDLTTLTLAALYYHPSLDVARAQLDSARAAVREARQIPNPSLGFEDLSYGVGGAGAAPWTATPFINFLIETAGKRKQRTREARAYVDVARDAIATQSWAVRAGVRTALLQLWDAQRQLTLLREGLDFQRQLTALLQDRFDVGEASALDLGRERTQLNQARLAADQAQGQLDAARAHLAGAIGVPLHAIEDLPISVGAFDAPPSAVASSALQQQALTARSDVQGLLAQYAAAESALALEVANQYPNLSLSPGYTFDSVRNRYVLLPEVQLPVFNLHRGSIAVAAARRREAAARFTALQSQIIAAIDDATVAYRAATREVATATAVLRTERQRERQSTASFQAGQIDRPTWLTVRLERVAAAQLLLSAQLRQLQALGALEDALHHPFFGPPLPHHLDTPPRDTGT